MPAGHPLSDDSFQSVHVTGYFPTTLDLFIPDIVVVDLDGLPAILERNFSVRPHTDQEKIPTPVDVILARGQWVAILDGSMLVMSVEELESWRSRKAIELVQSAMEIRGSPLKVLRMLESAALLRNLNLGDFVSTLKTQRANESENLESVFLRVRGNQAGGRTA